MSYANGFLGKKCLIFVLLAVVWSMGQIGRVGLIGLGNTLAASLSLI
jgi:hypothetical protein